MFDVERAILLLSGGIDSTTVLAALRHNGAEVTCLIFDYGQSLAKEIEIAAQNARRYQAEVVLFCTPLAALAPDCSLLNPAIPITTDRQVEQIAAGETPTSYVPFRNGIFFSYAVAYGEAHHIPHIFAGCNGLHSGLYWDDTTRFGKVMMAAARTGTAPNYQPAIRLPFAEIKKSHIVEYGLTLGVDYAATWSCYQNGDRHCGRCDSCAQRRAALAPHGLDLRGERIAR